MVGFQILARIIKAKKISSTRYALLFIPRNDKTVIHEVDCHRFCYFSLFSD
jgi:hypothetical protein